MKHHDLIKQMTLEEKASLMSGASFWYTKEIKRLGVPAMMLTDGPHGLRKQLSQTDNLGLSDSVPSTCYPTAAGLANTWDEALIEELGEHLGHEAAAERVSVLLGPGMNIKRNPLCGRNFEYFSEDPYLSGKIGAALIRGIQKNGISACAKHFAVNSQEFLRMTNDSVLDERTLREIYLPSFEMAVKEGGVKCVMSSYNRVNGSYANENMHLLRDILYGEWGFEGMVVTDWGANNDRVEGLKAGDSLEMPSSAGETDRHIVAAVQEGRLDEAILDEQLDRLLEMIYNTRPHLENKNYDRNRNHDFAARAAEETAVLLKNEGALLPIDSKCSVAVIGDFAKTPRYQGAGSSLINPTKLINAVDALKAEGAKLAGYSAGFRRNGRADEKLLNEALELARGADVVLLYLGLAEADEAEGMDRSHLRLPENQIRLLKKISAVNSNIAVVLSCGAVVEMDWDVNARAVIHGYLGGQAGATAIARLITGKANPSAKLAETIPLRYEDLPSAPYYPGRELTAEYREGIFVGYRYFCTAKTAVKYPFGYGLSYTSFEYSDIEASDRLVSFTLKNVGAVKGAEVSQLYVAARTEGMFRPRRELKGFARTELMPGEERRVSIKLDERSFAVWSIEENAWVVEPGEYVLEIGASSAEIKLSASIVKNTAPVSNPYTQPELAPYYTADVKSITDLSFKALIGREIPPAKWDRSAPLGINDALCQCDYLPGGSARAVYKFADAAAKTLGKFGNADAAIMSSFIMGMPFRNIARMSGLMTDAQLYQLMEVVNRKPGSFKKFVKDMRKKADS